MGGKTVLIASDELPRMVWCYVIQMTPDLVFKWTKTWTCLKVGDCNVYCKTTQGLRHLLQLMTGADDWHTSLSCTSMELLMAIVPCRWGHTLTWDLQLLTIFAGPVDVWTVYQPHRPKLLAVTAIKVWIRPRR